MPASWSFREKLPRHGARDGDYIFDSSEGERAIRFFERRLWIPEGDYAGERYRMPPWQDKYLRALYGWRLQQKLIVTTAARTAQRGRRYRRSTVGIPRGNLKSILGCGIGLKGLVADRAEVPTVVGAGTDRINAGIIYSYASYSIQRDPGLRRRLITFDGTRRIRLKGRAGGYTVIAAKEQHSHGGHPRLIIVDDLQAQPSPQLLKVLRTSQITLSDSLFLAFMTAGLQRKGPGWIEWQRALKIADDPALDERYLPCLYYAEPEDDYADPAVWLKANPSLGFSIREEEMRETVKKLDDPDERNEILNLNFNVWTDSAVASWISAKRWTATAGTVDEARLKGLACFVGVMAPSTTDIAAVAYVFPPQPAHPDYELVLDAFVPKECIEPLEEASKLSFARFVEDGWLTDTEGDVIDEVAIVESVKRRAQQGWRIQEIAYNPRGGVGIMRGLQEQGFTVMSVTPGLKTMSPAMHEFERLVIAKAIHHGADRLLAWEMSNLHAKKTGLGDLAPDGDRSTGNITGPVAALMALGRIVAPTADQQVMHWGVA